MDVGLVLLPPGSTAGRPTAQKAFYMHVDDTAAIATGNSVEEARRSATGLMEWSATALVEAGFRVDNRHAAVDKQRIVGYEVEESPARLRAPAVKTVQVRAALLFIFVVSVRSA